MISCVILAAGKGTRMKSKVPKVLHLFQDRYLLHHVLDMAYYAEIKDLVLVVGYKSDLVISSAKEWYNSLEDSNGVSLKFAIQKEQLGTGHAVSTAEPFIGEESEYVCVVPGDVPLISYKTINHALEIASSSATNVVITTKLKNPFGYGRIIRGEDAMIQRIIEQKDASDAQKKIEEINTGIFVFLKTLLFQHLSSLKNENSQNEYYLTDMVDVLHKENAFFTAHCVEESNQFLGVNSLEDLKSLTNISVKSCVL